MRDANQSIVTFIRSREQEQKRNAGSVNGRTLSRPKRRHNSRSRRGQGIVEGVVGLVMLIGGGVMVMLLILNSGAAMFFKQKLMPVTSMAAQYAGAHASDPELAGETTAFVQDMMSKVGLAAANLKVTVNNTTVGEDPAISVTVTNNFPLFGNGNAYAITLSDTELAVW